MDEVKKEKRLSLRSYLAEFTKEQLIGQILELSKKYKTVKSYYDFSINPDIPKSIEKVKDAIQECFYPSRGFKLRLKDARNEVSDFKKLSPGDESVLDIMLYYVECGVFFTNDFGDMDEPYYNSIVSMFKQAGILYSKIAKNAEFRNRAEKIMNDSTGIGWGFYDDLAYIFDQYFE